MLAGAACSHDSDAAEFALLSSTALPLTLHGPLASDAAMREVAVMLGGTLVCSAQITAQISMSRRGDGEFAGVSPRATDGRRCP